MIFLHRPLQQYREAALDWCNERRLERGMLPLKELPKGQRLDSHSCPCGKATSLSVGYTQWTSADGKEWGGVPVRVRCFISHFDGGHYPDLEIPTPTRKRK